MPFPLPRWTATGWIGCGLPSRGSLPRQPGGSASMTSLSRPVQDSLALRPTRLQQHLSCYLTPRLRHGQLPAPHRLGGYRGEPKTPRTDLSSAGPLRLRGALTVPVIPRRGPGPRVFAPSAGRRASGPARAGAGAGWEDWCDGPGREWIGEATTGRGWAAAGRSGRPGRGEAGAGIGLRGPDAGAGRGGPTDAGVWPNARSTARSPCQSGRSHATSAPRCIPEWESTGPAPRPRPPTETAPGPSAPPGAVGQTPGRRSCRVC